ncbi:MAG: UDP-2,4-diacetamido-2,4,6-trideoxy-beta-L-altropyranose hydrolase [Gammaproteobacteria bacterium]|jgi:UDP-2,4-diacetamido-2,4,6-trideoxy-beta-L-altropyranose hydrolase|nr:MAG: UDP-2,4-diacetamido-2,4,6-trideoxy-beta-L-altropyranose hydrolase [Gammaproteobacteria bacterium]PHR83239.1 MAG: UDP-2,4-diacetamido-2,4,6-trideoxy-beta-L-altropyranose hydrolase [Colwellia sp.]
MNIVIRADSSIHIGTGHTMRCLVLARELRKNQHSVSFAIRVQEGDSVGYIEDQGFIVHKLPSSKVNVKPMNSLDYSAWLQVPWLLDAEQFIEKINKVDLVVTDHYALDYKWQKKVKSELDCKIFAIDDLVRHHDADLILDQTLMRSSDEYKSCNANILTGCDFALLNPLFSHKREFTLENKALPHAHKLLISLGGIDKDNVTLAVLHALSQGLASKPKVTVLLSRKAPHYEQVKLFCSQNNGWIKHIDFVNDMAELMLAHSISIGAPGTTSWERACLGIPSIIIPLAENQLTISKNLVKARAAILVNRQDITKNLIKSYLKLIKKWSEFRQNNLKICDGLGVYRVVESINNLLLSEKNKLVIRSASFEDIQQIYDWQCHPDTRRYALINQAPCWTEHQTWMKQKLESVEDYFYIIKSCKKDESVGVIRLDRIKKAEYLVSIFVSPEHYGQGIAKWALSHIDNIHRSVTLHATVLEDNIASQQLFISANYQRVSADTFVRLPII